MKLKTSFQVLTILALLALGPDEAREIWFSHSPDQLYGERLLFSNDDGKVYIGRNSSSLEVVFDQPVDIFLSDLHSEKFHHVGQSSEFSRLAQGIIFEDSRGIRRSSVSGHLPKAPGKLFIHTESEVAANISIVAIIFVLTGYLTYLIADYQSRFSPQFGEESTHESSSPP